MAAAPGEWSQRQARTRHLGYVRERTWRFGAVAALFGVPSALLLALVDGKAIGFVVGAIDASVIWMLAMLVVQETGTGPQIAGAQAAQMTADELRGLRRSGWRLVHEMPLRWGDVDHVAVGPGGVLAIETKWSSPQWSAGPDKRIAAAADQAWKNARHVKSRLRVFARPLEVTPLVVLWSPEDDGRPCTSPRA